MLKEFNIAALGDLDDGRVAVAFAQEVRRAVMDCMDRPGDANARTVALEFKLTPVVGEAGECEGTRGEFHVKSKVPTRKSKIYDFRANKRGHLTYSSESPEDVDQTTIFEADKEGKVRREPLPE